MFEMMNIEIMRRTAKDATVAILTMSLAFVRNSITLLSCCTLLTPSYVSNSAQTSFASEGSEILTEKVKGRYML